MGGNKLNILRKRLTSLAFFAHSRKALMVMPIVTWALLSFFVVAFTYYHSENSSRERAQLRLDELAFRLDIELERYRSLPRVLAMHPLIQSSLRGEGREKGEGSEKPGQSYQALNRLLSAYNRGIDSDAVYVVNRHGLTAASSNWQASDSFVGVDYGFRPYIQQALAGDDSHYFALGTVSGKRGYYFSHPIMHGSEVIGALVIKVALHAIEKQIPDKNVDYLLLDNHGVVFFSTHAQWNYGALTALPQTTKLELLQQRKFGDSELAPLTQYSSLEDVLKITRITLPKDGADTRFTFVVRPMRDMEWYLSALVPASVVTRPIVVNTLIFTVFFVLVNLIAISWRRTAEARNDLQCVNETLEQLVDERTSALRESNTQLRATIEKQHQTENTLKMTQQELIQAGKLALLGEMSAGINHELNQPLSAMRIYIENALLLAKRGQLDQLSENLGELLKLNKMLAQISGQYKIFSRKATGKVTAVRLCHSVDAAIAILENKLNKAQVAFHSAAIAPDCYVMAEKIPLEQVIINLLNNAIQAVANSASPSITLSIQADAQTVCIRIIDNGKGIADADREKLFEPFFTTKKAGLGLGLTLSKRIVASFGGTITVLSPPEGGAEFCIRLKRYFSETQSRIPPEA
ncbi:MAG: GHKL domain-containing protein [Cellvibrionaceae bacterium]|nr:GHKL domain-containing protein [Cellvibrionaceae bacterium]